MFGIALARLDSLSDAEKERYQALYCGLCLAIKRRYGNIGRAALSYDLAFLEMLYNSLYEPCEETGQMRCMARPKNPVPYAISQFSDYCADLSVALAYHKCLDDIADDDSAPKRLLGMAAEGALRRAYRTVRKRIAEHCEIISSTMDTIRAIEADPESKPDEAANAFGDMLGFLVECVPNAYPDFWSTELRAFGKSLGNFIYLMDAAVDFAQDAKSGAYNPFVRLALQAKEDAGENAASNASAPGVALRNPDPQMMRDICAAPISRAAASFERLPLVQDDNLMRSVIYSGVWQKFNHTYAKRPDAN